MWYRHNTPDQRMMILKELAKLDCDSPILEAVWTGLKKESPRALEDYNEFLNQAREAVPLYLKRGSATGQFLRPKVAKRMGRKK